MKRFRIGVIFTATVWLEVEAEAEEEAVAKAILQADQTLCHHCSDRVDMEDATGECVVDWARKVA